MARAIQDLLDQIQNAVYGEEVRGAIHDSIEQCYDDVTTAKTSADTAVASATAAAANANIAAQTANDAADEALDAASSVGDAILQVQTVTASATSAINDARSAISDANAATLDAIDATDSANQATIDAREAAGDVENLITVVNTAVSNANNAASSATSAATSATQAAAAANNAASLANTATTNATNAASSATTAASGAIAATGAATNAASSANTAAASATEATSALEDALADVEEAIDLATAAAESVTNVTAAAVTATNDANAAATNANAAASGANDATVNCNTATYSANTAVNTLTTAGTRAINAAQSIEGLTVSATSIAYDLPADAQVSDVSNHKNIVFYIPRGEPGEPFKILGDAYDTVADLAEDVPSPHVGDIYNVGTTPPYELYRWTGSQWENQGTILPTLDPISTTDVDAIWNGTSISATKYLTSSGLYYVINSKIFAALSSKVDAVSGKGLSTNDYTDAAAQAVSNNTAAITSLQNGKVDKVNRQDGNPKVLSDNSYTDAEKTKLAGIEAQANKTVIDAALSSSSTNPVQNKIVNSAIGTVNGSITTLSQRLAPEYSTSATYNIGDHCVHNQGYYKCITRISTAEAWNPNHWAASTIEEALGSVVPDLSQIEAEIAGIETSINSLAVNVTNHNLTFTLTDVDYLPQVLSNNKITVDHEPFRLELSNPNAQKGDWTVGTSAGSVEISGSISGTTDITVYLTKATIISS